MPSVSKEFWQLHKMYLRILNYYLGATLISALCQYRKHRNQLLNISHLVDMMTDTQHQAKTTTATKPSQENLQSFPKTSSSPFGKKNKG